MLRFVVRFDITGREALVVTELGKAYSAFEVQFAIFNLVHSKRCPQGCFSLNSGILKDRAASFLLFFLLLESRCSLLTLIIRDLPITFRAGNVLSFGHMA